MLKFHHLGIACADIQKQIDGLNRIHNVNKVSEIVHDELQSAFCCMVSIVGGPPIELISGESVKNILHKGVGLYHICYSSDNFDLDISRLVKSGALAVSRPKPAKLFEGKRVAFFYVSYGLIEIMEA